MNFEGDDVPIPLFIQQWFQQKGWHMHVYQKRMFTFFAHHQSVLLIAPTGGGKTLASFLPVLASLHAHASSNLHTLYISPLKALANDIQRALLIPLTEMKMNLRVAIRTGDTSSYQRQQQLKKPPHILLTTPESLMLLLSHANATQYFAHLKTIIIDELHSFAYSKRGDLTSLALAQLNTFAPSASRIGLSATVAQPKSLARWLAMGKKHVEIIRQPTTLQPVISLLTPKVIPYSGYRAHFAVPIIYQTINQHELTLIFVNTRANTEFLFHQLWLQNEHNLPIALYHGSLSKEQRSKTEALILNKQIRALVTTSALELGIDWHHVDAVIQVGAPHGVSRLLQRIGRSNHQFNQPSLAYIVPTNCFDAVESMAAIKAIKKGRLDQEEAHTGALDVVVQFIINCACSQPIHINKLFTVIRSATPYKAMTKALFLQLFQFARDGGYTLEHYPQFHRLIEITKHCFAPASLKVIRRHRQNIGTIIEAAHLKVKVLNKRKNKIVGDIEESFIQELLPGECFLFAGEILEYLRVHDMFVETRKTKLKTPKIPAYKGGNLPLTTFLAQEVRQLINHPNEWILLPPTVQEWLALQQNFSLIPSLQSILVEQFPYKKKNYLVIYSFEGRKANHSLGMLLTRHLEQLKMQPEQFTSTDYSVAIRTGKQIHSDVIKNLFKLPILLQEFESWLQESSLLKRTFRQIAIISGLIERQIGGSRKTMKQVTFSTDLIYEVLQRYEPEHILLRITHGEASKVLLDFNRLLKMLERVHHRIVIKELTRPSPFSIPVLANFSAEHIAGEAEEALLHHLEIEAQARQLINEVKQNVPKPDC